MLPAYLTSQHTMGSFVFIGQAMIPGPASASVDQQHMISVSSSLDNMWHWKMILSFLPRINVELSKLYKIIQIK